MIPQRNTIEKIHTKMWCATPEGQEEVEFVTLNSTGEGKGDEENKKKKNFLGVYPIREVFLRER